MWVTPIVDKLREARLRWYGHVQQRSERYISKMALEMIVDER